MITGRGTGMSKGRTRHDNSLLFADHKIKGKPTENYYTTPPIKDPYWDDLHFFATHYFDWLTEHLAEKNFPMLNYELINGVYEVFTLVSVETLKAFLYDSDVPAVILEHIETGEYFMLYLWKRGRWLKISLKLVNVPSGQRVRLTFYNENYEYSPHIELL
jgi:hypothetical protein